MGTDVDRKILIIDDDPALLCVVEAILEKNGYSCLSADNGRAGVDVAQAEKPDLIVLDSNMPELDGNETLTCLKNDPDLEPIPVIMLTGNDNILNVQTSFELGASDYIVKPFNDDNFLIRVQKVLKDTL